MPLLLWWLHLHLLRRSARELPPFSNRADSVVCNVGGLGGTALTHKLDVKNMQQMQVHAAAGPGQLLARTG